MPIVLVIVAKSFLLFENVYYCPDLSALAVSLACRRVRIRVALGGGEAGEQ
jgi:hypothetical protein